MTSFVFIFTAQKDTGLKKGKFKTIITVSKRNKYEKDQESGPE